MKERGNIYMKGRVVREDMSRQSGKQLLIASVPESSLM